MDARVRTWLSRDPDPATREELQALVESENKSEIDAAFAARLAFGTAGLRGVVGPGPARMNRLVVRETTAGLGSYLIDTVSDAKSRGVVIAFDARNDSRVFAEDAAATLAALGIKVVLGDRELPTPIGAFALRELEAAAAVVVTASHNPPEYNGYKVYWENGAQIIPPHDGGIAAAIEKASTAALPFMDPAEARGQGLITPLGPELIEAYYGYLASISRHAPTPLRGALKLAYTPLHGVGAVFAEEALRRAGFDSVLTAPSQRKPDGSFPTVRFPNPEEPGAMDAVLELASEARSVLAFANDPDADRLAVAVRLINGDYRMLSGNEIGVLLASDFMENSVDRSHVATTIVSSRLLRKMAESRGCGYFETLTGLKWIANGAIEREAKGDRFLFGYEEALGYLIGNRVLDKDGISAMVCLAELADHLAAQGKNLMDRLEDIYRTHGLYVTGQKTLALEPGAPSVGDLLRAAPQPLVGGRRVISVTDLKVGKRTLSDGETETVSLPKSDVLVYAVDDDARIIVRPSGTEPKLKCYYEVHEPIDPSESLEVAEARARDKLDALIDFHQAELAGLT